MKIDGVDVSAYTVPTDAAEADGTLHWDSTTLVLVRLRAGGQVGMGWTYGPPACASVVRDQLSPVILGGDPLDIPRCCQAMVVATRNASRPGVVGYAISAVDIALWDLKATLLGVPLHRLLGTVRDRAPVYGSGGFTSYDNVTLAGQLQGWVDAGIPRVKIKIGEAWGNEVARDVARIALAREVIGDATELFVDANGAYGRKQAIRVGDRLAEFGVDWFEEPVSSDDLEGLAAVRAVVRADVTAGEYGSDAYYFRRMCQAGAVDCLQMDATRCGGITEWLRAAGIAGAFGLQVSGHCAPHVHLAAALATPNFRHLEWFHDHVRIESMFFDGAADPTGGMIAPRDEPGLGLRLRGQDAEQYRVL
ncbi:MAG: enolase C-terminal domain-like protein [Sciscionella sp.]